MELPAATLWVLDLQATIHSSIWMLKSARRLVAGTPIMISSAKAKTIPNYLLKVNGKFFLQQTYHIFSLICAYFSMLSSSLVSFSSSELFFSVISSRWLLFVASFIFLFTWRNVLKKLFSMCIDIK
ncbi:hypothetical protein IC582_006721 [Cucumis melo]